MDQKKFGEFVKKLREEKNLNQEQLGNEVHVHRTTVNKCEKGNALPLNDTLVLLSNFFDVSIDELLAGERFNNKNKKDKNKDVVLDLLNHQRNLNKYLKINFIILIIVSFVFLSYYFFKNYNTISVYGIRGEGEKYNIKDGVLIITKNRSYIKLGTVIDKKNNENLIADVNLYVEKKNGKQVSVYKSTSDMLITDYNDFKNLYLDDTLKDEYDNFYVKVIYKKHEEIININLTRYFKNEYLFSKHDETFESFKKQNMHEYLIRKNFKYDEKFRQYSYENGNLKIYYNLNQSYIIVFNNNPKKEVRYRYNLLNKNLCLNLLYVVSDVDDYVFNTKDLKKLSDEEYQIYSNFKENYLDIYFPFL